MIALKVDPGNRKVFVSIGDIRKDMQQAIRHGWFDYGKALKKEANREILHGVKTGTTRRLRKRSGVSKRHTASAPGETHANFEGDLRKSIRWKVEGFDTAELAYGSEFSAVNQAPEYAAAVEFGSKASSKRPFSIAARPSLLNAINATQGDAKRALRAALDRALKK